MSTRIDALVADVCCIPSICINDPINRYIPSSIPALISLVFISTIFEVVNLVLDNTENETMNENRLNNTGGGAAIWSILLYKPLTIGVYVPQSIGTMARIPYLTIILSLYSFSE